MAAAHIELKRNYDNIEEDTTKTAAVQVETSFISHEEEVHIQRQRLHRHIIDHIRDSCPRLFKYLQMCIVLVIIIYAAAALVVNGHLSAFTANSENSSRTQIESRSATIQKSIDLLKHLYTFISLIMGLPISMPTHHPGTSDQQSLELINSQLERLLGTLAQCNTSTTSCF